MGQKELKMAKNHCAQKTSVERGDTPPPLTEKIRLEVFEGLPKGSCSSQRECPQPLIALSATKHKYMYCTMYIHVVLYNTSIYVDWGSNWWTQAYIPWHPLSRPGSRSINKKMVQKRNKWENVAGAQELWEIEYFGTSFTISINKCRFRLGKPLFEMCCFHMGIARKGGV